METILAHGDTPWLDHYSVLGGIGFLALGLILIALLVLLIRRS